MELCKPCGIKAKICSQYFPDNRKCPNCGKVSPIETLFKKAEVDLGQAKQIVDYCEECNSVFLPQTKQYNLGKLSVLDKVQEEIDYLEYHKYDYVERTSYA